ncbi:GAF domain-containing sensor histidine kinase [Sphingomonas sp.]|uniref:GAF domain-containing sensor histidine kinase n=1 Tax=Sphingomonas sp. TaxID=28214 RepID=UPI002FDB4524
MVDLRMHGSETSAGDRREARLLGLLADCAGKMLGASDPTAMIDYLFGMVRDELLLDVYFHYRAEPENLLVLEASGGLTQAQREAGARLQFGQAVCGMVARDRTPRVVAQVQGSENPMTNFIRDVGLDSYACTPLLHGEVLLGTLGFGRRSGVPFTETELRFLRTICSYVAVAKNRLLVEAEMLAAMKARDALEKAQRALIGSISRSGAEEEAATAAMLAHEMVQPLSAASNYIATVEMALRGTGGPDVLRQLARARAQISRSSEIVARTRTLVERGELHAEFVAAEVLFDEALELFQAAWARPAPTIDVEIEAGLGALLADRVQIGQVLANLLRNAAQVLGNTESPRIVLSARAVSDGIEIAVADNGPGFPGGAFPERGCSSSGGQGIGLAVTRRILEAHETALELESRVQGGSKLRFVLAAREALV